MGEQNSLFPDEGPATSAPVEVPLEDFDDYDILAHEDPLPPDTEISVSKDGCYMWVYVNRNGSSSGVRYTRAELAHLVKGAIEALK